MSVSKKTLLISIAILSFFVASPARAEEASKSLPALAMLDELLIQPPQLGNKTDSRVCNLSSNDIADIVAKKLKLGGLPVISLIDAKPPKPGAVRVFVTPEVTTMDIQNVACVSYVGLTIKSQETLLIFPVKYPRYVTVNYWGAGIMVNSSRAGHMSAVEDGFDKLSKYLARQFRQDQPPKMSLEQNEGLF
jgi:hypothetical protein